MELINPDVTTAEFGRDWPFGEHFERTFGGRRDERLLAALSELVRTRSSERIDVAIVYGAGHVKRGAAINIDI